MSDFMSDFKMAEFSERSSIDQFDERVKSAIAGLRGGLKSSTVVRSIADQYGVSDRQARRYVREARYEMWDAPGSTLELQEAVLESLEHLQRMSDAALAEGDKKTSIAAAKAAAHVAEKRLAALQRDDHFSENMAKRFGG